MMQINLTLLLFVLFYTVTAHRGGRGHAGWDNSGRSRSVAKSSQSSEENCREALKDIEECCEIPSLLPAESESDCTIFAADQPPELPMFGTVGKGAPVEDWGWDEWTNSCSRGLGGYGPISWDDDDDNELDDDFEFSSGFRGKAKKNTHHGKRTQGRKGGSSSRMSSNSGTIGPWSPGRECFTSCVFKRNDAYLPDRSLNAEKAIAMIRKSLSNVNSTWTQLVESAAKECATKTAGVDITAFNPPRYAGEVCSIAADIFYNCIRQDLVLKCPSEYKTKAGSTCPKRVARVQLCSPFAIPSARVGDGRDHHDRCGSCGGGSSSEEDDDVGVGEEIDLGGYKGVNGKKSPQPNKKAPTNQKSQAGKAQNGNKVQAGVKKPAAQPKKAEPKKGEQKKAAGKQGNAKKKVLPIG